MAGRTPSASRRRAASTTRGAAPGRARQPAKQPAKQPARQAGRQPARRATRPAAPTVQPARPSAPRPPRRRPGRRRDLMGLAHSVGWPPAASAGRPPPPGSSIRSTAGTAPGCSCWASRSSSGWRSGPAMRGPGRDLAGRLGAAVLRRARRDPAVAAALRCGPADAQAGRPGPPRPVAGRLVRADRGHRPPAADVAAAGRGRLPTFRWPLGYGVGSGARTRGDRVGRRTAAGVAAASSGCSW